MKKHFNTHSRFAVKNYFTQSVRHKKGLPLDKP